MLKITLTTVIFLC